MENKKIISNKQNKSSDLQDNKVRKNRSYTTDELLEKGKKTNHIDLAPPLVKKNTEDN